MDPQSLSLSSELYPSQDDLLYEEEILRNPFNLKLWWRYLIARTQNPFNKRAVIYERALKALPGSYKLWYAYLCERLEIVRNLPITHTQYKTLNNTFERALVTMHKMPRIWVMYLQSLTQQKLLTRTRRTFDRALRALPVTQHDRIWDPYMKFVSQKGVPVETSLRVYPRYLTFDPNHIEDFIDFLLYSKHWQEAAERLAGVLNDDSFCSIKSKKKYQLWLELCDLLISHSTEVSILKVDAIIRGGIRKFTDEVGRLWTSLADYYIRHGLFEKAREIFEEGMMTVVTVRDFSVIFDAYSRFEESTLGAKMETLDESTDDEDQEDEIGDADMHKEDEQLDRRLDCNLSVARLTKELLRGFWLNNDSDIDLRLTRLENLIDRRPELTNSVLLRQNPHNVEQWHRRVKLFESNPTRQIRTYTEAVRTVDPMKAVGNPHTLWVAFAKLYEYHNDVANARVIFEKGVQVGYKTVDNLATLWCEWAEMELRHKNFRGALELMKRATGEPSVEVKQRAAAGGKVPVQMKLHKCLQLWAFYVDLEESLGNLESTRAVYERILDLKIATPQMILNYALLLEEHKYFEDAFKVYERGVKIFKYPHVKDIWNTYLSKFVKRYGHKKLERARELFEHAVEKAPAEDVKPLYLLYAQLEENYGLAKHAMKIYHLAAKSVPDKEKMSVYEIYVARAAESFGVAKTREIYEDAIQSALPAEDIMKMCMKYAELEMSLGEIDRARAIHIFSCQFLGQRSDSDFWRKWNEFEVEHGNQETFREMLRIKRSVVASYSQAPSILPKRVDVHVSEMGALERQFASSADDTLLKDSVKKLDFVNAEVAHQKRASQSIDAITKAAHNKEDIDQPEDSDSDGNDKIQINQKNVPSSIFGYMNRSVEVNNAFRDNVGKCKLGALERMKKRRLN